MPTSFHARRGGEPSPSKIFSSTLVGHVYLDTQLRTILCLNEAARRLALEGVPFSRGDLRRQGMQTIEGRVVHPDELPLFRAWHEAKSQEATFVLTLPASSPRQVCWTASPVPSSDGVVRGVVGTVRVSFPEPDWLGLAGLAHDLGSPLQAIRTLIPVLESAPMLPEAAKALDQLRNAADRALALGLELLEWCRRPTGPGKQTDSQWFDLTPLLAGLGAELVPAAQRKGIALNIQLDDIQGWEAYTDRNKLSRLVANLLTNAVRYTRSGKVNFSAQWRRDEKGRTEGLVLAVEDTGVGISPEEQESIFQPFERGRSSKDSDAGGSGLGLAVVDRLVSDLGLTLDVFSEYGKGSKFDLLLPMQSLRSK
jgi:hypothetical protein